MKDSELIKRIWQFAGKYKWAFLFSYAVLLIELVFEQMLPAFLGDVINTAVYEANISRFVWAALLYAAVFFGFAACGFIQLLLWQRLHNKYVFNIRFVCYQKVLRLKPRILADIKTGDVIKTINGDTEEFHNIIQRYGMRIINAGIGAVTSLVIVAVMKREIALFMLVAIPFSVMITKRIQTKMKSASDKLRATQGQYSAWTMEILRGMREVKLFAAEKTVLRHFMKKNHEIVRDTIEQDYIQFKADELLGGIYFLENMAFYIICAVFVATGSIDIGEYVAIASYFTLTVSNVRKVLGGNVNYQWRKTCVEHVLNLLDEEEEAEEGLSDLCVTEGRIDVRNLTFSYDADNNILEDVNLQIAPGEKIGIVGQSGVGKSTLASLLLKFYEPQKGDILIDGVSLKTCTGSSIRQSVGIVSQENIIFHITVRENITFGVPASDQVLWDILEKVYLKNEIEKLPYGLDTVLDGSDSLSGGQNQRLCVARLFFQNPKIIILDEATSALDIETESTVQKALDALAKEKTTIVISHRCRALLNTDKILVLKDGREAGCDCYEKLMSENQYFSELFAGQKEVSV
ncbi:MAG: ABC transporter ATP-binding protein [Lachnospiraceae bacterium]|nr:ABC transporter ATP-binding protein [Lachnospiraceae bacterium]